MAPRPKNTAIAAKIEPAPGPKAKAKKTQNMKKTILDLPLDSDNDGKPETEDVAVDWKDDDLNWQLINYINDCDSVKQGLFPSPGNNTRSGKGIPKSDHHFAIASFLFAFHPKYKNAFARVQTAAGKRMWATKVKNRLSILVKQCRQYTSEMGETGMGITSEDQIDMSLNNEFTTKWGLIQQSFPWYWVLRDLISERPNVTPVGLGNTSTGFDTDLLTGESEPTANEDNSDEDNSDTAGNDAASGTEATEAASGSNNEDIKPAMAPTSCKCTSAKPATSTIAPKPSKKLKTSQEKFSEIAVKEEETMQKLLDIKKQKMAHDSAVSVAAIQAKAQLKIRRSELQAQLVAKREEYQFQLDLARIQSRNSVGGSSMLSFGSSVPSSSNSIPSSPFSYSTNAPSSDVYSSNGDLFNF